MRDYQGCAERGLTQAETARELGVTRTAVSLAAKRFGIVFTPDPRASTMRKPGNGWFARTPEHNAAISAGMRRAWAKNDDLNGVKAYWRRIKSEAARDA
jgi:transcriptional regulator with XRE-family HTH domain